MYIKCWLFLWLTLKIIDKEERNKIKAIAIDLAKYPKLKFLNQIVQPIIGKDSLKAVSLPGVTLKCTSLDLNSAKIIS